MNVYIFELLNNLFFNSPYHKLKFNFQDKYCASANFISTRTDDNCSYVIYKVNYVYSDRLAHKLVLGDIENVPPLSLMQAIC